MMTFIRFFRVLLQQDLASVGKPVAEVLLSAYIPPKIPKYKVL